MEKTFNNAEIIVGICSKKTSYDAHFKRFSQGGKIEALLNQIVLI